MKLPVVVACCFYLSPEVLATPYTMMLPVEVACCCVCGVAAPVTAPLTSGRPPPFHASFSQDMVYPACSVNWLTALAFAFEFAIIFFYAFGTEYGPAIATDVTGGANIDGFKYAAFQDTHVMMLI